MKIYFIFFLITLTSCKTRSSTKIINHDNCQYEIAFNPNLIDSVLNKNQIWLSSVTGIKPKALKGKLHGPGSIINFSIDKKNLKNHFFNDLCHVKRKRLNNVKFYICGSHDEKKLCYSLYYVDNIR